MIRRTVSALILAAATLAPISLHAFAVAANPVPTPAPAQAKVKMVKMTLKNKTNAPMDLLIEDKPVTIAANGEYALSAPEGTHVYGADKVVKVMVTKDLDGASCSFR